MPLTAGGRRDFAGVQLRGDLPVRHAGELGEHWPQLFCAFRLSRRPLLSVLCRRIYYTAVDRFCAPVAPAAQLKDNRCHCMPDIFSQGERGAFAFEPLVLALQLPICFEVRALSGSLVSSTPE
jgi:hypothetical protein